MHTCNACFFTQDVLAALSTAFIDLKSQISKVLVSDDGSSFCLWKAIRKYTLRRKEVVQTVGLMECDLVQLRGYLISPPTEFFGSPTITLDPNAAKCENPLAAFMVPHGNPAPGLSGHNNGITDDEVDKQVDKIMMTVNW